MPQPILANGEEDRKPPPKLLPAAAGFAATLRTEQRHPPAAVERSPTYSPRRITRLQGTTLTTALEFVERDLALQRGSNQANVSTAEAWLEDMLDLVDVIALDCT